MSGLHLITGASRGIGAAIAVELAAPGRTIGVNYLKSREAAERAARLVEAKGAKALLLPADATSPVAVDALFDSLPSGPLESLVLNAGVPFRHARVHENAPEEFERQWRVQAYGAFLFCRRAAPIMAKQRSGRIIFVLSSSLEGAPPAYMSPYVSAKYALWGLAKSLEAELSGRGVAVRCLFPGMTQTDLIKDFPRPIVEAAKEKTGRLSTPEEVAADVGRLLEAA